MALKTASKRVYKVQDDGWRIPEALWQRFAPLIPRHVSKDPIRRGRPPADDRVCLDAIFFVLRTSCQWKALDATGICPGSTAHDRFQKWAELGVFEKLWECDLEEYDEIRGLNWRWLAMDGCITKAPLGGEKTGPSPVDRAKKGTKRSLITEGCGIPVGIAVGPANRNDFKLVEETFSGMPLIPPVCEPGLKLHLCLDKGYDYNEVYALCEEFGFTTHIQARGEEAKLIKRKAGYKARRWVVERTHSWMNRFRRILTRWEKKASNYLALLHFSCAWITYKCAGIFG